MKISDEFDAKKSRAICPVPLLKLSGCKWPLDSSQGTLFCNESTDNNVLASYCTYHSKLAYQPSRRK